ncbi:MAG: hypothetical protein WBK32_02295 [Candidatus Saccharicenans sp.]
MTAMAAATSATAGWLEPGLALGLEAAPALPVAAAVAVVRPVVTPSKPVTGLPSVRAAPEAAGSS